jgi:hypothetical protein
MDVNVIRATIDGVWMVTGFNGLLHYLIRNYKKQYQSLDLQSVHLTTA